MPAIIPGNPSATSPARAAKAKARALAQSKKTRVVRRRGRAPAGAVESDDEIEREIATDSESEDGQSSLESDTDSDTEPASEDVIPNGHTRILTPNMTQNPDETSLLDPAVPVKAVTDINGGSPSFFGATGNWSEMVTDETANGPADLPVIDFAEFDGRSTAGRTSSVPRSRKQQKASKKSEVNRNSSMPSSAPSASPSVHADQGDSPDGDQPIASTSRQTAEPSGRRGPGQSARQAYQQRLETDPSYVPTVGEFWGHDDRLLDKDLRSLSGWWRGRWQGRGRGRGSDRGFPGLGRGRGGFSGENSTRPTHPSASVPAEEVDDGSNPIGDVPPIDRPWGHDGFEEMKRREDRRRSNASQGDQQQHLRGGPRGRGAFLGNRGRGASMSPRSPANHLRTAALAAQPGRTWFAMKPERVWTVQHDAFLHFDPALKPRPGQGPGLRVKFPGGSVQVIRAPPRLFSQARQAALAQATRKAADLEDGEKAFVVRLPPKSSNGSLALEQASQESFTTMEAPPIDDIFIVRPELQAKSTVIPSQPDPTLSTQHPQPHQTILPDPIAKMQLEQLMPLVSDTNATRRTQTEEAVLRQPSTGAAESALHQRPSLPTLPPIQTTFSPPPQPSPSYGSPYGYAPPLPLPPGIAMDQHGMPYEVSTGRHVYLQPPQVYNPRQVLHAPIPMPYNPSHVRHHTTVTPDFLAQAHVPSHTPPIPMSTFVDPSTGATIFSMPRQTSRIEIRAPHENPDSRPSSKPGPRRPSGLRSGATAFEPSEIQTPNGTQEYYGPTPPSQVPPSYEPSDGGSMIEADPAVMAYNLYSQPYYYPDQYGYSPYMNVAPGQPYEVYPIDTPGSQSATYH